MTLNFYSGKDQFCASIVYIIGVPFAIPHIYLYGDKSDAWLLLMLIILSAYVWAIVFNYRFFYLFSTQGKQEKLYIFLLYLTVIFNFCYSLFEIHPFSTKIILVWVLFFTIYASSKIFVKNIKLAESLGIYNPTKMK